MGVVSRWRGQGIGRKLIVETLKAADDAAEFLRIQLSVYSNNDAAINLYRSVGFQQEGVQRKARISLSGFVDVIMMARLQYADLWNRHSDFSAQS
ncbi:GNAT family N-acetyltransferase [Tianweitania populi]